jgi:hypothetical protein
MINEITADWKGAAIVLRPKSGGPEMMRPAAFVFDTPGGFGWLEPSYADPWGSPAPSWHEVEVTSIRVQGGEFYFDGPEYSGEIEWSVGQIPVAPALDWFEEWLKKEGRTWPEERARVLAELLDPNS